MLTLAPERVIVVGAQATGPERYAAEMLQAQVQRRFGIALPIHAEDMAPPAARQVLLLGQPATNRWLERLCRATAVELSPTAPGPDGFVIACAEDGTRQAVVIGGSNPRGVVYGQHAFFDLLRREGGRVVFPAVSVRDWPSIAWRGRPQDCDHATLGGVPAHRP